MPEICKSASPLSGATRAKAIAAVQKYSCTPSEMLVAALQTRFVMPAPRAVAEPMATPMREQSRSVDRHVSRTPKFLFVGKKSDVGI